MNTPSSEMISVVVPVYCVEAYLEDCLKSIINQTYVNLEIILVDDGSPDNCPIICDKYSKLDGRVRVIHKQNGGVSSARNEGINAANGEWIAFVDSDDTIQPDYFEVLIRMATEHDADIAMGISNIMEEDGSFQAMVNPESSKIYIFNQGDAITHLLKADLFGCGINKMYRKQIWKDIKFDLRYHVNEDLLANYYCFCAAKKVVYTSKRIYNYRSRKNSASRSKYSIKQIDSVKVNDIIQKDCKSKDLAIYKVAFARFVGAVIANTKGALLYLDKPTQVEMNNKIRSILFEALFCNNIRFIMKIEMLFLAVCPSIFNTIIRCKMRMFRQRSCG